MEQGPCALHTQFALPDLPVCRRPTLRGAGQGQGVKVELPTGRTTFAPWPWSARLCLGRRWTGRSGFRPSHGLPMPEKAIIPEPECPRRRHVLPQPPILPRLARLALAQGRALPAPKARGGAATGGTGPQRPQPARRGHRPLTPVAARPRTGPAAGPRDAARLRRASVGLNDVWKFGTARPAPRRGWSRRVLGWRLGLFSGRPALGRRKLRQRGLAPHRASPSGTL